jgi:hypothetical protein
MDMNAVSANCARFESDLTSYQGPAQQHTNLLVRFHKVCFQFQGYE